LRGVRDPAILSRVILLSSEHQALARPLALNYAGSAVAGARFSLLKLDFTGRGAARLRQGGGLCLRRSTYMEKFV
jgi:hypothetical protein